MIMKRLFSLLFISMVLICIGNMAYANSQKGGDDHIPVPIRENSNPGPRTKPRSIVYIPVECYYSEGEIYISGEDSISGIEATVTNLSSNVSWSAESNNNYLQMSVSSASGDYYIVITLADGREYEGYYTLP